MHHCQPRSGDLGLKLGAPLANVWAPGLAKDALQAPRTADRIFFEFQLAKGPTGLGSAKSIFAPSVRTLAAHFANKMFNGKGGGGGDYESNNDDYAPLSTSKIRRKAVPKPLRGLDPYKFVGDFGNPPPRGVQKRLLIVLLLCASPL